VIAELLAPYCREHGIVRLELFGSSARGHARRGSDVDLIATFNPGHRPTGLRFLGVADELAKLLGVPVDLLTADDIAEMNVYRKTSILAEAREIFSA
jgi:predicted nucleotidyltransferase